MRVKPMFRATVERSLKGVVLMSSEFDPKRLEALDEKLSAARKAQEPEPREESHISQAQAGWRMVTELVTGLLLGFGIGFGLDALFGTTPWLMIIFIGFGFAAGIRTMMRTAKEIEKKNLTTDHVSAPSGKEEMYDDD